MLPRVVVLGTLFSIACFGIDAPHPTEAELKHVFDTKRDKFELLATMAEQDRRVVRIAPDFTWLDSNVAWPRPDSELGFTRQRWDEYRALFKDLGLRGGTLRQDGSEVLFLIASAQGLVTGGSDKGYAFSRAALNSSETTLDQTPPGSTSGMPTFKRIEGNWYLYVRWDD
jgi:hypothetical protein